MGALKIACIEHEVKEVVQQDLVNVRHALKEAASACELVSESGAKEFKGLLDAICVMVSAGDGTVLPSWEAVYEALEMNGDIANLSSNLQKHPPMTAVVSVAN